MRLTGVAGKSGLLRGTAFLVLGFCVLFTAPGIAEEGPGPFATPEKKKEFTAEVSSLIEKAWKKWQDAVLIDGIDVEGARGMLMPGDMDKSVLTASGILEGFDRKGRSREYIKCVKIVTGAVADGMRKWQKGYSHKNIPFLRGASCTFTLPPTSNVPVTVASGRSSGDRAMTRDALYNYMLYRVPGQEEDILVVFAGSATAISECFTRWKGSCSIVGILASGGIAPHPAPMGTGPGPVRGAKGKNGKLVGPYFNAKLMRGIMLKYFESGQKGA